MGDWLASGRADLAADAILDAAAGLFAQDGVAAVGMGDIARAAGCSRATIYRHYADRDSLRRAFVLRESARIGLQVKEQSTSAADAVLLAVGFVRSQPALVAWFTADSAGLGLASALDLDDHDDPDTRWLVRCIASLLAMPGRDSEDERDIVEHYVTAGVRQGRDATG